MLRVSYPRSLGVECLPEGGARRRGEKRERVFERSKFIAVVLVLLPGDKPSKPTKVRVIFTDFGNLTCVNLSKWNAAWK